MKKVLSPSPRQYQLFTQGKTWSTTQKDLDKKKKKTKPEKKKSKFKLQFLKKKYYGWAKSSPRPHSSNQFLLFSLIWRESSTHSLFELLACVELFYAQQHFLRTVSVDSLNTSQTSDQSTVGQVNAGLHKGRQIEKHYIWYNSLHVMQTSHSLLHCKTTCIV